MRVLGVDPGPRRHGWALLELAPGEQPHWIGQGHSGSGSILAVAHTLSPGDHVVIERPQGYVHEHKRGADLIETTWEAAKLFGRLAERGAIVHALGPEAWRQSVVGKRTPSDSEVRRALRLQVLFPPGARTNSHHRDAGGVALAGATHLGLLVNGKGRVAAPARGKRGLVR